MNTKTMPPPAVERGADHAQAAFARAFGALTALRLESCIHCGMCADACHFYIATGDPKYTPIWKAEPLKRAYRRQAGPFAPLYRLFGRGQAMPVEELAEWQELLFDSCNLCGRCSLICPMGIDVTALIEETRHALFAAGLTPHELSERARNQQQSGAPETPAAPYRERLAEIAREYHVDIPLDRERADVLLSVPRTDLEHYPAAVAALARIVKHLGLDATFCDGALIAENYGYYAGSTEAQHQISRRLIAAAERCGAKWVIVPECGHAYYSLRWEAAELCGRKLPFKVRHITEFLAAELDAGRLKLKRDGGGDVAFHDPCQLVRRGGVSEAPRQLFAAMGVAVREMANHKGFSFCCAGGGGVYNIERATALRYRAQQNKLREIDATGAGRFYTSCSDCRQAFADAERHFQWDKTPHSLIELVAAHLQED